MRPAATPTDTPEPIGEPTWEECLRLLEELTRLPVEARVVAFEQLVRSSSPGIRCQALRIGAAVLSEDRLASYLRNDADAVLRNAGLEILKMRGGRGFGLAVELLRVADPDVVLQAVMILDHLKDPRAFEPLRALLDHADPNVVQVAIVGIGHLGDARAIPDLIPFLDREPWVQVAAVEALGDLRSQEAARPLGRLLPDLIAGPMAAEALARIGGNRTFRTLARHWLRF
jgi:HEAT repeat protein